MKYDACGCPLTVIIGGGTTALAPSAAVVVVVKRLGILKLVINGFGATDAFGHHTFWIGDNSGVFL